MTHRGYSIKRKKEKEEEKINKGKDKMSTVTQWSFELKVLNHNSQPSFVCVCVPFIKFCAHPHIAAFDEQLFTNAFAMFCMNQ